MTAPQIWQIAAGEEGRRYDELFEKHDVMFLGPGYPGSYDEEKYRNACIARMISKDECERVARFATQVRRGDYVLARRGKRVVLLGLVDDEECCHRAAFDDIHGWDVSHTIRVLWQPDVKVRLGQLQVAEPLFAHMKQIKTFTRADACVVEKVKPLLNVFPPRALNEFPKKPPRPWTLSNWRMNCLHEVLVTIQYIAFVRLSTKSIG